MSDINLAEAIKVIRPFMGCCIDCPHEHSGVDVADAEALLAAALPHLEQQIRERIAAEIEARYLGPDFGRSYDGRDSPSAHLHDAYDEGLETAARIARGTTETP